MEKKNTLLLTVIAIATLLVAVVGATYAYFASDVQTGNNIPVSVNTASGAGTFIVDKDQDISINITSSQMLESKANNTVALEFTTPDKDTANLTASLSAPEGQTVSCTYDVVWVWTSSGSTGTYTPTTGLGNALEFTLQVSTTGTNSAKNFAETNMSNLGTAKTGTGTDTDTYYTLVTGAAISASDTTGTTDTWTAQVKFYNLELDQSSQQAKSYTGAIKVKNVQC